MVGNPGSAALGDAMQQFERIPLTVAGLQSAGDRLHQLQLARHTWPRDRGLTPGGGLFGSAHQLSGLQDFLHCNQLHSGGPLVR